MIVHIARPLYLLLLAAIPLLLLLARQPGRSPAADGGGAGGRRPASPRPASPRPASPRLAPPRQSLLLVLRALALLCLAAALAGVELAARRDQVALIALLDRSDSVRAGEEGDRGLQALRRALAGQGAEDSAGLVVFGAEALTESAPARGAREPELASPVSGHGTGIAAAIRLALASFPARGRPRILLLSDGNENLGRARSMAANARALGVEIHAFPLRPASAPGEVRVRELAAPRQVRRGERHRLDVLLEAGRAGPAQLVFLRDGTYLGADRVELAAGANRFQYGNVLEEQGLHRMEVLVEADGDGIPENNRGEAFVRVEGQPGVLYLSQPGQASRSLLRALEVQGIRLSAGTIHDLPDNLADLLRYDAVILDNVPAFDLSLSRLEVLERYVRDLGGGLLVVGGQNSLGAGGYYGTPLERALPVSMDATSNLNLPSLALIIVVDKSGSMEGLSGSGESKLDLVKSAVFSAVDLLNPYDRVGLLAFDADFEWTVPVSEAGERQAILRELAGLKPGGGTDLFPALREAYQAVARLPAANRHLIVLSDGLTNEGDFDALLRRMAADRITVSTVAVGDDADTALMARIAELGGGRGYFTDKIENVPRIFTAETRLVSRSLVVEQDFLPGVLLDHEIMGGLEPARLPALRGFVRTYLKPAAQEILSAPEGNPLLAVWPYGLGRAAVFTSDLKERWGRHWLAWEPFPRFAAQLVRWLRRAESPGIVDLEIRPRGGRAELAADARDEEGRFVNFLELQARMLGPQGETAEARLEQTAPGRYAASFPAVEPGEYLFTLWAEGGPVPLGPQTWGLAVPYSAEYAGRPADLGLLEDLAALTGGSVIREEEALPALFRTRASDRPGEDGLRVPLLLAALFLFLAELTLRRLPRRVSLAGLLAGRAPGVLGRLLAALRAALPGRPHEPEPGAAPPEPALEEMEQIMVREREKTIRRLQARLYRPHSEAGSEMAARLYLARLRQKRESGRAEPPGTGGAEGGG